MQTLVKDFNYTYDLRENIYILFYLDNDFKVKIFNQYETTGIKITDIVPLSVDARLLTDISDLIRQGFRLNPYLVLQN